MKAIVTIGLPASGKSTFAKTLEPQGFIVIERDRIRKSLAGESEFSWETWDLQNEKKVTEIEREAIGDAAKQKRSIVVSDTNLNARHREELLIYLKRLGFEIELVLFDAPCSICEERNLRRPKSEQVPFHVIPKLNATFVKDRAELLKTVDRIVRPDPCCGICRYFELSDSYFGFCVHRANPRKEVVHTACHPACSRFEPMKTFS